MKKLMIILITFIVFTGGSFYLSAYSESDQSMMSQNNMDVILHIEEGAPMTSMDKMSMMDMMGRMFEAENIGSGQYQVKFTPTEKGYYTMHTHAIPAGKSMMSMMNNHMDIGIIAK